MTAFDDYQRAVESEDWSTALRCAQAIAERTPNEPTCWFNVGVCMEALERHVEAAESFQRVIQIDWWDARARYRMIRSLYLANAIQIVYDELKLMVEADPGFVTELFEIELFQDLLKMKGFASMLEADKEAVRAARSKDGPAL